MYNRSPGVQHRNRFKIIFKNIFLHIMSLTLRPNFREKKYLNILFLHFRIIYSRHYTYQYNEDDFTKLSNSLDIYKMETKRTVSILQLLFVYL